LPNNFSISPHAALRHINYRIEPENIPSED
jgi:hypothetical protein